MKLRKNSHHADQHSSSSGVRDLHPNNRQIRTQMGLGFKSPERME